MKQYLDLCRRVLEEGIEKPDRTGTGTLSVFGAYMTFDLQEGFPLLTTKDMSASRWNGIVHELLWMLKGDTNIKYLVDNGVNIWNKDAYRYASERFGNRYVSYEEYVAAVKVARVPLHVGDLGRIYGKQWRSWEFINEKGWSAFIDQLAIAIRQIKENPHDRRHLIIAFNPGELEEMALPPCHYAFQFYVDGKNRLCCSFVMRSSDVFLGLGYNIASYALLTHMVAHVCGLEVGTLAYHNTGDVHIYKNHIEQVKLQLTREPKTLPKLVINRDVPDIDSFRFEDFEVTSYDPHPAIKGEMSS